LEINVTEGTHELNNWWCLFENIAAYIFENLKIFVITKHETLEVGIRFSLNL